MKGVINSEREKQTRNLENKHMVTRREWIVREFQIDIYTLLYLKSITNKDLLYSTGNSAQHCVTT